MSLFVECMTRPYRVQQVPDVPDYIQMMRQRVYPVRSDVVEGHTSPHWNQDKKIFASLKDNRIKTIGNLINHTSGLKMIMRPLPVYEANLNLFPL